MTWDVGAYEYQAAPAPPSGDTTLPTIHFVTPNGANFFGNAVAVRLAASDDKGVVRVELFRAGLPNPIAVSGELNLPYGTIYLYWQASVIPKGQYPLTAYAFDAAGNKSLPATITINRK